LLLMLLLMFVAAADGASGIAGAPAWAEIAIMDATAAAMREVFFIV
jgi:hypothetical protein